MTTNITIANNALALLGDDPISDFNEGSVRASLVSDMYENVLLSTLRMLPWNCAIKRVVLSPSVGTPVFGFTYKFNLPSDWVRTLSINEKQDIIEFKIEGRTILTDVDTLQLRYVFKNEDAATYDSGLVDVLTFKLAAALAYPITKSTTQAQLMEQKADMAMRQAKGIDAVEEVQDTWFDDSLISRRGI